MATQIPKIQVGDEVRDMTADEIAQLEIDKAAHVQWQKEQQAKAKSKADVIAKLGLTADEVAALLS
jgi:hypothetical protein